MRVSLRVNGEPFDGEVPARLSLADLLRDRIGLTGTHLGCEHGICGACTVQVDGEPARSCLMFAAQADGSEITTIEALAPTDEQLHPLQQAFHEHHALQCGFCTPGFLMSVEPLLPDVPGMDDEQLRGLLAGNLCRCTGYQPIVDATRATAAAGARTRQLTAAVPAPGLSLERLLDLDALGSGLRERADDWDVRLTLLDRDDRHGISHLQADGRERSGPGRVRAGIELAVDGDAGLLRARVSARSFGVTLPDGADEPLTAYLRELVDAAPLPPAPSPPAELTSRPEGRRRATHAVALAAGASAAGVAVAITLARRGRRRRRGWASTSRRRSAGPMWANRSAAARIAAT
jgi:aerobic carbon-monoxide dehydrogenase small subunit